MRHDFKKLKIWQSSMGLVKLVYPILNAFPKEEVYALTSQIKKSVISIPSNIAEGSGRSTDKDFAHFLHIAYGSCCKLETQLIIAKELGYLNEDLFVQMEDQLGQIQKMIIMFKQNILTKEIKD